MIRSDDPRSNMVFEVENSPDLDKKHFDNFSLSDIKFWWHSYKAME